MPKYYVLPSQMQGPAVRATPEPTGTHRESHPRRAKKYKIFAKVVFRNVLPAKGAEHIFKDKAKKRKENMPTGVVKQHAVTKIQRKP